MPYVELFEAVGVDVGVSPREVVAEEITRFTREGGAENVALIESDKAEVLEIEVEVRVGPHVAYTPVKRVEVELSAGESTTWTHSYRPKLTAGSGPMSMRFKLNWRDGRISTETMVEWPS